MEYFNTFQTAEAYAYRGENLPYIVIVRRGRTGLCVGRFCGNRTAVQKEICRLLVTKLNQPIPTLGGRDGYKIRVRR